MDWLKELAMALIGAGVVSTPIAWLLNRRVDRANVRIQELTGDKQLDELLDEMQKTMAVLRKELMQQGAEQVTSSRKISDLEKLCEQQQTMIERLKAEIETERAERLDWESSVAQEDEETQTRIKGRLPRRDSRRG